MHSPSLGPEARLSAAMGTAVLQSVSGRPELPGDARDAGMLTTELPDRPPTRPHGQQRPRPRELSALLGERPHRTPPLSDSQVRLRQTNFTGRPKPRHVDQAHVATAVAASDDHAPRAPSARARPLDHHLHPAPALGDPMDLNDMERLEPDQQITAVALPRIGADIGTTTRASTRRRLGHRRGLPVRLLGRTKLWKAPTHPAQVMTACPSRHRRLKSRIDAWSKANRHTALDRFWLSLR